MSVNQARPFLLVSALLIASMTACSPAGAPAATPGAPAPSATQDEPFELRFLTRTDNDAAIAARVGGTVITIEDVQHEAVARGLVEDGMTLHPETPEFANVLGELVDQRLLALEAAARTLDQDREARRRLAAAEERILGNVLVETAISNAVTEEAVRRVYEEQNELAPAVTEIRARHILLDTREEADEVARLLAEGSDFAQLAARVSRDPATRFQGGDLGYFTRQSILDGFGSVAFATAQGEVSEPFQTDYGWHVLTVTDIRRQPRASLDEKRGDIVRFLTLQGIDTLLSDIRQTYPVTIETGPPPDGLRGDAAQQGDADAGVQASEPQSDETPSQTVPSEAESEG